MRTVVLDPLPAALEALLERRRALGQDLYDEVWNGEYHMSPAPHPSHGILDDEIAALLRPLAHRAGLTGTGPFNLGEQGNYRVPDRGLHRGIPTTTYVPTAAVVIEIVSPGDETWDKLDFYAARQVGELLIADPREHSVTMLALAGGEYARKDSSALLGVSAAELAAKIDWPAGA